MNHGWTRMNTDWTTERSAAPEGHGNLAGGNAPGMRFAWEKHPGRGAGSNDATRFSRTPAGVQNNRGRLPGALPPAKFRSPSGARFQPVSVLGSLSLAPGFSRVSASQPSENRFNGFRGWICHRRATAQPSCGASPASSSRREPWVSAPPPVSPSGATESSAATAALRLAPSVPKTHGSHRGLLSVATPLLNAVCPARVCQR
jgi:hypothetical protein